MKTCTSSILACYMTGGPPNLPKAISVAQGIFAFGTEKVAKGSVRDDATKCQLQVYIGHNFVIKGQKETNGGPHFDALGSSEAKLHMISNGLIAKIKRKHIHIHPQW
jgi:hypothetical protein